MISFTNFLGRCLSSDGSAPRLRLCPATSGKSLLYLSYLFLFVGISVFVFTRLWHLSTYSLDGDEIFSVQAARQSWGQLLSMVTRDLVHPPLSYALLKVWIGIGGESLFWLRLLPVLLGIATVAPLLLLCKELDLEPLETSAVVALVAVNGYLIGYSQQVRMYSLLLLCSVASIWLFTRYLNSDSDLRSASVALFFVNLLLVYSHYFGWLIVGLEGLAVLLWDRRRILRFTINIGTLILCYYPWVFAVVRASKDHELRPPPWITAPTMRDLVWFYATLNGSFEFPRSTTLGILLFAFPIIVWGSRLILQREAKDSRVFVWLALLGFLPPLIVFSLSRMLQSVWGERHLVISAVPYLILVAVAANRLRPALLRTVILSTILVWSVFSGFEVITAKDRKIQWDGWVQQIISEESQNLEPVTIFTLEEFVTIPIQFYLESEDESKFRVIRIRDLNQVHGQHFWVAFRNTTWKQTRQPEELLADAGYHVGRSVEVAAGEQKITAFSVSR